MKKLIVIGALATLACSAMAVVVAPRISVPHAPPARVYVPSTPVKVPVPAMKVPLVAPHAIESAPMKPVTIPPTPSFWPSFYPYGLLYSQCDHQKDKNCK